MSISTIVESGGNLTLKKDSALLVIPIEDFMALEPAYPQGVHAQRIYRNQEGKGSHTLILDGGDVIAQTFPWPTGEAYLDKIAKYTESYGKTLKKRADLERAKARKDWEESLTYAQKRAIAYPEIGDQLDAIWKGSDSKEFKAMADKIKAVKENIPKE